MRPVLLGFESALCPVPLPHHQVMREVTSFLKMLDEVYGIFGLDYTMALSTRPESYLGELVSEHTQ